ncbi:MAG: hypothetical protein EXR71_08385 [Myxococcales bacterium]|nr:hypothetical protein [Myxococcales bacterium]
MSQLENVKSVGLPHRSDPAAPVNVSDLEEFHDRHARDTWWARIVLITMIFGMLALNLWMTERTYEAMLIDVDASRMAASDIDEQSTARLEALARRLDSIESRLPRVPVELAAQAAPPP